MGLASKLAAASAGGGGAAPAFSAPPPAGYPPSAPPMPAQAQGGFPAPVYGQQPPSYPPSAPPAQHHHQQQQPQAYPAPQYQQFYPGAPPAAPGGGARPQQPPPAGPAGPYPGAAPAYPPPQAGGISAPPTGAPPGGYGGYGAGGHGGATAPPAGGGGAGIASSMARLQAIVQANGLQRFYPPAQLEAVARRVAAVDFHALAARWRMPAELALDLAALALYDVVLYCDDSGSMAFEDGGERIEDLKLILGRVAEITTLFDDDGILVRFMNSPVEGNGVRSAADAAALLSRVTFGGTTPLAASMRTRVLEGVVMPLAAAGRLAKPVLVVTITDGEPTDTPKDAILQVIRDAKARLAAQYGPKAVAYQFAQVGRDARAQAFLGRLDRDPAVGDVIDCTSYFEQEAEECARKGVTLSVEAWLLKLMLGAIDPSYDAEDEAN